MFDVEISWKQAFPPSLERNLKLGEAFAKRRFCHAIETEKHSEAAQERMAFNLTVDTVQ